MSPSSLAKLPFEKAVTSAEARDFALSLQKAFSNHFYSPHNDNSIGLMVNPAAAASSNLFGHLQNNDVLLHLGAEVVWFGEPVHGCDMEWG